MSVSVRPPTIEGLERSREALCLESMKEPHFLGSSLLGTIAWALIGV